LDSKLRSANIVPYQSLQKAPPFFRRVSWRRWVLTVVVLAILFALLLKSTGKPRITPPIAQSLSHLHAISLAIDSYCRSHGEHYPDSLASLVADGLSPGILISPRSGDTAAAFPTSSPTTLAAAVVLSAPGHVTYRYLARGWVDGQVPADAIVAYEPQATPDDEGCFLLSDGHVEFVNRHRTAALIAAVSATTQPVSESSIP
jgi:hypothetical protein